MSETQPNDAPVEGAAWAPEAYRTDPSVTKYKTVEDFFAGHKAMESFVGADKATLLRLPTKEDAPEWGDVYAKLGRPEKPDGYGIKAEGPDAALWQEAMPVFHQLGLTAKQAQALHQFVATKDAAMGEMMAKEPGRAIEAYMPRIADAIASEAFADQRIAELKQSWGQAYDQKVHAANAAITALLEKVPSAAALFKGPSEKGFALGNFPGVMELMAEVGGMIAEPGGLAGAGNSGNQARAMTPNEAAAKVESMKDNAEFRARLMAGDKEAMNEWKAANDALAG